MLSFIMLSKDHTTFRISMLFKNTNISYKYLRVHSKTLSKILWEKGVPLFCFLFTLFLLCLLFLSPPTPSNTSSFPLPLYLPLTHTLFLSLFRSHSLSPYHPLSNSIHPPLLPPYIFPTVLCTLLSLMLFFSLKEYYLKVIRENLNVNANKTC